MSNDIEAKKLNIKHIGSDRLYQSLGFREHRILKPSRENKVLFYVIPLGILVVIVFYPLIYSLVNSFRKYNFIYPEAGSPFVWFSNFSAVLKDAGFFNAIQNTVIFTICSMVIELILALLLVALFNKIKFGSVALRSIILIPMVVSPAVSAIIWRWMYNPQLGIINYLLSKLGVGEISWLGSANIALYSLIIVDVWQWTPFIFLIIGAGFLSLPKEPFEAAMVDGLSKFQELRDIVFPLLYPSIMMAMLLKFIYAVQVFDYPFIMTSGGPGIQTETINLYIYRRLFMMSDVGMASAASWLFLIIVIAVSQVFVVSIMKSERWR